MPHSRRHITNLTGAFVSLCLPLTLHAAQHQGRVLFNGLPVPGATVIASQSGKQLQTVTDAQGLYQFTDMTTGTWTIRIELLGFAPQEHSVEVSATTQPPTWDLAMQPLAQVLAAAAAAPPPILTPPPAPTSATSAAKPDAKPAETVTPAPPPPPSDDGMIINGSELNAATSKYSIAPAFGSRRAGTKSLYNGGLGLTASNSIFDARPYSITGLSLPKAGYNRFTLTANLGGPIRIPHLIRNGPNLYFGYQFIDNTDAQTFSALVPTAAQRAGDLSGTVTSTGQPVTVTNPITGQPITGPVPVSPQAAALLALYPLPNLAGNTLYNYQTQVLTDTSSNGMQLRLDKGIGRRDQVYGGFNFRNISETTTNVFHFTDAHSTLGIGTNANWIHRFPRGFLMTTGYEFSRIRRDVQPYFAGVRNVSGQAGITGNEQSSVNWGPPSTSFSSGLAGLNDAQSIHNRNRTDRVSVSTTWTHRKHVVTFGGDFRRQEFNELTQANPRGTFTFTGAATASATTTGSDIADFLLGTPDTSTVAFGNADKYFRQSVYDAFVTDDWRIKPELTINTGIRWDYGAPLTELFGRLVNLDLAPNFTASAPVLGSSPVGALTGTHYPTSLVRPDKTKFQPRVGISWRPFPTASTVVRAGYGIYVDTSVYPAPTDRMAQQAPLSKSLSISRSAACPITLANGFLNCGTTTPQTFALDPNFRVGYAQIWRLSVQNDLPGALVLTATYNGTRGSNGVQQFLPNTNPIGVAVSTNPIGFVYQTSTGSSIRNAGELQLRRRLRNGLTATLNYVYAHSIDDDAALGGGGYQTSSTSFSDSATAAASFGTIAQNWRDLHAERSNSSFDQRHLLSATFQYTTGQGLHGGATLQGWKGRLFKEWLIASQLTAGSGLPETPSYFATVPGTGFSTFRASRASGDIYAGTAGRRLNPAAYIAPPIGTYGNAGRYSISGPGTLTLDTSLARVFRLTDKLNFDTRVDATNLLNHAVFTAWNSTINSTTFGLPVSTQAMRSLQFTGRLRF